MARLNRISQGFTLIELLMVIAISSIVVTIAVPSFNEVMSNSRRSGTVNSLVADMNLARSEALKRAKKITVCKSSNGTSCDTTGSNPYSWDNGWLIFADMNGDAVFDSDGDSNLCELGEDCMLRKQGALNQVNLTFPRKRLTFDVRGTTVGYNGKFIFCDNRGVSNATGRSLSSSGRLSIDDASLSC